MVKNRPFDRASLLSVAVPSIRPPIVIGALVWRYTVLVPLAEGKVGDQSFDPIADNTDIDNLGAMFSEHFSGVTVLVPVMGYGLRDPNDPTSVEVNRNMPFVVYATPISASDRYFDKLEHELCDAFQSGRHSHRAAGGVSIRVNAKLSGRCCVGGSHEKVLEARGYRAASPGLCHLRTVGAAANAQPSRFARRVSVKAATSAT